MVYIAQCAPECTPPETTPLSDMIFPPCQSCEDPVPPEPEPTVETLCDFITEPEPATVQFLRTTYPNSDVVDTEMDGTTPYTVQGTVDVCP